MASSLTIQAYEHPIKSVTVFKSSTAEVVRNFTLDLHKGQNKLQIRGLSSFIDTKSVRVSGLGDARLLDVVCTLGAYKASYAPDSSMEVIRTLSVKKASLASEKAIRQQEPQLLLQYAKTLNGQSVSPEQMAEFLETYVEQSRNSLDAVTELDEKIVQIDRQIEAEQEKVSWKRGTTNGQVDIVICADTETSVELKVTYIVSNVEWKPTYELHATTENGKPSSSVLLHYRARVNQGTGEDWNNTSLTLSTADSDTFMKRIPHLNCVRIHPRQYTPARSAIKCKAASSSRTASISSVIATAGSHPEDDEFEEVSRPSTITEPTTVVSETPIAMSLSAPGESTIPSDGVEHQVSVAILPFEAKISYISIPRIDPRVFLQCQVTNSSEYRLLSGPVAVIMDDTYISKTSINNISTGDNFECTLGDDVSTKVTYSRSRRTAKSNGGTFSEVTNTTTHTTNISIHNKHQFDITDLVVRDVIPTAEDKRASIVLHKPAGLADTKDGETVDLKNGLSVGWEPLVDGKGGEKEGRFEWKWKVGSGAKVNLEAEWDVTVPGEVAWVESF